MGRIGSGKIDGINTVPPGFIATRGRFPRVHDREILFHRTVEQRFAIIRRGVDGAWVKHPRKPVSIAMIKPVEIVLQDLFDVGESAHAGTSPSARSA